MHTGRNSIFHTVWHNKKSIFCNGFFVYFLIIKRNFALSCYFHKEFHSGGITAQPPVTSPFHLASKASFAFSNGNV